MVEKRKRLSGPQNPTSENPQNGLTRPVANFKSAVLRVAAERLNRALTAAEVDQIENDLVAKMGVLSHTPDHPPYAAMIRTALQELNEEGGSSEESISNFIIKEFPDLPYAHSAYLKYYLSNLCDREEILINSENHYLLVDGNAPSHVSSKSDKPNTELKIRRGRLPKIEKMETNGLEIVVSNEQNEVLEEHNKQIEEWDSTTEVREADEDEAQPDKQMKIKLQLSENKPKTETTVSENLPLTVVENVEKTSERQLRTADRNKKREVASTTALILKLVQPKKSQPLETVKCRGRGRPRKIKSPEEIKAEKSPNQQQPKRRGRPRKVDS